MPSRAPIRIASGSFESFSSRINFRTVPENVMISTVGTRFSEINDAMTGHQTRLQNTDWKGDAKDGTVALVTGWTTKAKAKATEAQTKLVEFINRQIEQVNAADVAPSA